MTDQVILTRKEAAAVLRIGTVTFDALTRRADDPVPTIRVGHKVFIPTDKLKEWIDRQENAYT